jgi:RNA recognition motif-containing protein
MLIVFEPRDCLSEVENRRWTLRTSEKELIISHKIFAGNLSFGVTREELLELFGTVGPVVDIHMPLDKVSGRPRGFAFVEYESEEDASRAIETLNGKEVAGRTLRIDEARERPPRIPSPPPDREPWHDRGGRPAKAKGSRRGLRRRKRGF